MKYFLIQKALLFGLLYQCKSMNTPLSKPHSNADTVLDHHDYREDMSISKPQSSPDENLDHHAYLENTPLIKPQRSADNILDNHALLDGMSSKPQSNPDKNIDHDNILDNHALLDGMSSKPQSNPDKNIDHHVHLANTPISKPQSNADKVLDHHAHSLKSTSSTTKKSDDLHSLHAEDEGFHSILEEPKKPAENIHYPSLAPKDFHPPLPGDHHRTAEGRPVTVPSHTSISHSTPTEMSKVRSKPLSDEHKEIQHRHLSPAINYSGSRPSSRPASRPSSRKPSSQPSHVPLKQPTGTSRSKPQSDSHTHIKHTHISPQHVKDFHTAKHPSAFDVSSTLSGSQPSSSAEASSPADLPIKRRKEIQGSSTVDMQGDMEIFESKVQGDPQPSVASLSAQHVDGNPAQLKGLSAFKEDPNLDLSKLKSAFDLFNNTRGFHSDLDQGIIIRVLGFSVVSFLVLYFGFWFYFAKGNGVRKEASTYNTAPPSKDWDSNSRAAGTESHFQINLHGHAYESEEDRHARELYAALGTHAQTERTNGNYRQTEVDEDDEDDYRPHGWLPQLPKISGMLSPIAEGFKESGTLTPTSVRSMRSAGSVAHENVFVNSARSALSDVSNPLMTPALTSEGTQSCTDSLRNSARREHPSPRRNEASATSLRSPRNGNIEVYSPARLSPRTHTFRDNQTGDLLLELDESAITDIDKEADEFFHHQSRDAYEDDNDLSSIGYSQDYDDNYRSDQEYYDDEQEDYSEDRSVSVSGDEKSTFLDSASELSGSATGGAIEALQGDMNAIMYEDNNKA